MGNDDKKAWGTRTLGVLGVVEGAALGSLMEKRFGLVRSMLGGAAASAAIIGLIAWFTRKPKSQIESSQSKAFSEPQPDMTVAVNARSHVQRLAEERQSRSRSL